MTPFVATRVKLWLRDGLSLLFWLMQGLRRRRPPGIRILVYHTIAELAPAQDRMRMSVSPGLFEAHLNWLRRNGYHFCSMTEACDMIRGALPIPPKAVAVTFDDGFHDVLTRAYPLLHRRQVPATLFVVPGYLDHCDPFPWLANPSVFERPLTWKELQELGRDQLVSIGSHAWSHAPLSNLPVSRQDQELERSKSALEVRLGKPVRWFAYPYGNRGSFSDDTIACLKRLGFEAACTNMMGLNAVGDSLWTLKRTRIGWEDRLWRFRLKMAGAYDWVDQRWRWR